MKYILRSSGISAFPRTCIATAVLALAASTAWGASDGGNGASGLTGSGGGAGGVVGADGANGTGGSGGGGGGGLSSDGDLLPGAAGGTAGADPTTYYYSLGDSITIGSGTTVTGNTGGNGSGVPSGTPMGGNGGGGGGAGVGTSGGGGGHAGGTGVYTGNETVSGTGGAGGVAGGVANSGGKGGDAGPGYANTGGTGSQTSFGYGGGGGGGGAGIGGFGDVIGGLGGTGIPGNGADYHTGLGGSGGAGGGGGGGGGGSGYEGQGKGGGGGGGGGNAAVIFTAGGSLNNSGTLVGGQGGKGENGGRSGGGGGGGNALEFLSNVAATVTNTGTGTIIGGKGGAGGGISGGGGGGGLGIYGDNVTIINAGTITGGGRDRSDSNDTYNGGTGGSGGHGIGGSNLTITNSGIGAISGGDGYLSRGNDPTASGTGGFGITGADLTIVNSSKISGGLNGNSSDGSTAVTDRGDAIHFTSGTNSLELQDGYSFVGNVVGVTGSTNTLILGGSSSTTFDVGQIGPYSGSVGTGVAFQNFSQFAKTGDSTWTLMGTTTEVTPWTISQGTLQISNDASLGDAGGELTLDGGTLAIVGDVDIQRDTVLEQNGGGYNVASGNTLTVSGKISGDGELTKSNTGDLVLTGDNTYSGGTIISAGTLQVGDGGTTGSLGTGPVTDNGTLLFDRSNTYTFGGAISGTGAVNQIGTGTTVLTGDNTYSGGTIISAGTLQVGDGGTTGALGTGPVTDNGTLIFNRSNTYTFDGAITGTGGVEQNGTGTTVLSGANVYSGPTNVNAGTLQAGAVNTFSPNSAVTVAADATLDLYGFDQTIPSLSNAGLVRLNVPGGTPGTVLNAGNYVSQGGTLELNVVLNEGGANSRGDRLVVNSVSLNDPTSLRVNNVGGPGALTVGNGIELVRVQDSSQSPDGAFRLSNRLVAGAYEYDLYHGGADGSADGNWYLRSIGVDPSATTTTTGTGSTLRPETGVYLRNLSVASGMFMHTLHDRLGEPQFTDGYQADTNGKVSSVWVRVAGNHSDGKAGNGAINLNTDTSLVHFGGDLARWSNNGKDRWLFGVMGAYGESNTDADLEQHRATNSGIHRNASGKVDGYGAGAYLTWYGNKDKPTGPYVDLWGMYGWYNNKVDGNDLPEESYRSQGWTVSAEAGYAFVAHDGDKHQWMIEPQAQVAYSNYSEDNHRERNGTQVSEGHYSNTVTRLGVRGYTRSKLGERNIQPFVEANWWHGTVQNNLRFDGVQVNDDTPKDTFELKAGVEGEIAKHWQLWGHLGWRQGDNDYRAYEGMVGVKFQF